MKINQSKSRNKVDSSIIYFVFFAFVCAFFTIGAYCGSGIIQNEAIKANVAHYTVNPQTGVTQFEWITNSVK